MKSAFLKMPRLGETMDEGAIVAWMIEIGQPFTRGQSIVEIETDKTVVEFPALGAGILVEKLVEEGDVVEVGAPIGKVEFEDGNDWITENDPEAPDTEGGAEETQTEPKREIPTESSGVHIRATPVARKLAREHDFNLQDVRGTGRRGRIEAADVFALSPTDDATVQFRKNIAYVDTGPQKAPLALLIHGFAGDHTTFVGLSKHLSRAGIRSVSVDLPGHGATLLEAETTDDLTVNLTEFVTQITGKDKVHIVAHSLGAVPAVKLAEDTEIASLTLIAPAGIGTEIDAEFVAKMSAPDSAAQVSEMLDRLTVQSFALSKAAIDAHYHVLSKGRLNCLAKDITKNAAQAVDIRAALRRIAAKTPVRIIVGHQDKIVEWQSVLTLSPKIAVHHFANSGHMPHWDQRREFNELLTREILEY